MDRIWNPKVCHLQDAPPFLNFGDDWNEFSMFLGRFANEESVECIVRKKQAKSSLQQNRYYYAVIIKSISEYTGFTPDETDSVLKWKFLKKRNEQGIEYVPSKMDLSTRDREQFHEDCRRWAAIVLSLNIPLPNEAE